MARVIIIGLGPSGCAVLSRLRQDIVGPAVSGRDGMALLGMDFGPQWDLPPRLFVQLPYEVPDRAARRGLDWLPAGVEGAAGITAGLALYSARQTEAFLAAKLANIYTSIAPCSGELLKYYLVTSAADPAGSGLLLYVGNLIRRVVYAEAVVDRTPPVAIAGVVMLPPACRNPVAAQAYATVKEIVLAEHKGWLSPNGGPKISEAESRRHVFDYACYLIEPAHEESAEYAPRSEEELIAQVAEWLALVTHPAVSSELRRQEADRPPRVSGPKPEFVAAGLALAVVPKSRMIDKCALRLAGAISRQLLTELPGVDGQAHALAFMADSKLTPSDLRRQLVLSKDGVRLTRDFWRDESLSLDLPRLNLPFVRSRARPDASPGECVGRWERVRNTWERHGLPGLKHALTENAGYYLHTVAGKLSRAVRSALDHNAIGALAKTLDLCRLLTELVRERGQHVSREVERLEEQRKKYLGIVIDRCSRAATLEAVLPILHSRLVYLFWLGVGIPVALLIPALLAPGSSWSTQLKVSSGLVFAVLLALAVATRMGEAVAARQSEANALRRRFFFLCALLFVLPGLILALSEIPSFILWSALFMVLGPVASGGLGFAERLIELGRGLGLLGRLAELVVTGSPLSDLIPALGQAALEVLQAAGQKGADPKLIAGIAFSILLIRFVATLLARGRVVRFLTSYRVTMLEYLDSTQEVSLYRTMSVFLEELAGEVNRNEELVLQAAEDIRQMGDQFDEAHPLPSLDADAGGYYLDFPAEVSLSTKEKEEYLYHVGSQAEYPDGLAGLTARAFEGTPFSDWLESSPGDRRAMLLEFSRMQFAQRELPLPDTQLIERALEFGRRPEAERDEALETYLAREFLPRLRPLCGNLPAGFPELCLAAVEDTARSTVAAILGRMYLERGLLTVFSSGWSDGVFGLSFVHDFKPGVADTWGACMEAYASHPNPLTLHTRVEFAKEADGWLGCDEGKAAGGGEAGGERPAGPSDTGQPGKRVHGMPLGRTPVAGPAWSSFSWVKAADTDSRRPSIPKGGHPPTTTVDAHRKAESDLLAVTVGVSEKVAGEEEVFDPYAVLGVNPGALASEIREAFDTLVRMDHSAGEQERDEAKMAEINRAYDLIGDREDTDDP